MIRIICLFLWYIKWYNIGTFLREYVHIFPWKKSIEIIVCAKFGYSVTKAYSIFLNKLPLSRRVLSMILDLQLVRISPWPTIVMRFSGQAGRDWERIDQEFVRFESERVTWLPQNDFHLVLSRQRDQFVRVLALAFDESFRQHGAYVRRTLLLFHFPALRFLVLSKHSLAKVSNPFFLLRGARRNKSCCILSARARSPVSFFSCGTDHENSSRFVSLFAS